MGPSLPTSRASPHIGALPSLGQPHKSCPREASCPGSLEHSSKSKNILETLQLSPHCVHSPYSSLAAAGTGDQPFYLKAGPSSIRANQALGKLLQELQFCRADRSDKIGQPAKYICITLSIYGSEHGTPQSRLLLSLRARPCKRLILNVQVESHRNTMEPLMQITLRACRAVALFHYSTCSRPSLRGSCRARSQLLPLTCAS